MYCFCYDQASSWLAPTHNLLFPPTIYCSHQVGPTTISSLSVVLILLQVRMAHPALNSLLDPVQVNFPLSSHQSCLSCLLLQELFSLLNRETPTFCLFTQPNSKEDRYSNINATHIIQVSQHNFKLCNTRHHVTPHNSHYTLQLTQHNATHTTQCKSTQLEQHNATHTT